jgi:nucleoside triphosphate diphosphatase
MTDNAPKSTLNSTGDIKELIAIMARLRDPSGGCPWDLEQTFATIAPYTIEEAYEVAGAIEAADYAHLKDELGDLLLQVVFHARMAEERGLFDFAGVARAIVDKMVRRHPHVFGGGEAIASAEAQTTAWEEHKRRERAAKADGESRLDGVTRALPALMRAVKLQARAAEVGFDWPSATTVVEKIVEEAHELSAADPNDRSHVEEEFGDLLFAVANLARHLRVDPETALRAANAKFMRRFKAIEDGLRAQSRTPEQATLDEMEALWQAAKAAEKP